MLEDVIANYQLYNPESFKKSKIEHLQLEKPFFSWKTRSKEQMMLDTHTHVYIHQYIHTHTPK